MDIKPPIIALEDDGEVCLFESMEEARLHYEWPEMESFAFYDGDGRPIKIESKRVSHGWFVPATIEEVIEVDTFEPLELLLLRAEIVRFFLSRPEHGWAREEVFSLTFDDLKQQLAQKVGWTRR